MPERSFDVYGRRPVLEALRAGHATALYIAKEVREAPITREITEAATTAAITVTVISRHDLDRALPGRNHQGVAIMYPPFGYTSLSDIADYADASENDGLIVALDGVQDPANVGSIIRSAGAAGAHGVILPKHGGAGITPAVVRASAGASEHMKVTQETNLVRALDYLKKRGYWSVGLSAGAPLIYSELNSSSNIVLVVGGEGSGLSRLVTENCDHLVSLPMTGPVESLNAAVATAIVLYDIRRQREMNKKS